MGTPIAPFALVSVLTLGRSAALEAARTMPTAALDYGDPGGSAVPRNVVVGYLRRVRAAAADPERIVIHSGYAKGLGRRLGGPVRDPRARGRATRTAAARLRGVAKCELPVRGRTDSTGDVRRRQCRAS
ncbi:hypothetical protein AB0F18_07360 [Streptomyces sp. NPDC029216]|uniref:hypothetical protein n=1 Tax=Streptomyces sp. NPDC029216 TaxID=3154701 RepID=UPI0033FD1219